MPQATPRLDLDVGKLESVPLALRSLPDARAGPEALSVSAGMYTGSPVSTGCWVSP